MIGLIWAVMGIALIAVTLTEIFKDNVDPHGRMKWAYAPVSVALGVIIGMALGAGGLPELGVLDNYTDAGSGALIGLLGGCVGVGGWKAIKTLQTRSAELRGLHTPGPVVLPLSEVCSDEPAVEEMTFEPQLPDAAEPPIHRGDYRG